jgi:hypothetical protein
VAILSLGFVPLGAGRSFRGVQIIAKQPAVSAKYANLAIKSRAIALNGVQPGTNVVFFVGQTVVRSFVFIHISGSTFVFNIFWVGSGFLRDLLPDSSTISPLLWSAGMSCGSRPGLGVRHIFQASLGTLPSSPSLHIKANT